jgi:hypothetical protein
MDIHNPNTRRKLNLHVKYCNTVLFKKVVINIGMISFNKVTDQIKLRKYFNSFKGGPFILLMSSYLFNF